MIRSRTITTWYADANDVGLRERAIELYWAAEREAYLRSPQAERDGA